MKRNRPIRILLLVLLLGVLVLGTAGCWDRVEVNDLAIVLAAGVDRNEEGKVVLSAQIFVPRAAGGGPQGNTGGSGGNTMGQTIMQSAEGTTIPDAMTRLQRKIPRKLFWGQSEVIVISVPAARQGIRPYMDFFLRYLQFREHAYTYISREKAEDVLKMNPPLERSSAEILREMGNLKLGNRTTLKELAQAVDGPSQVAALTQIRAVPLLTETGTKQSNLLVHGLGLIKKGKYIGEIQEKVSLGTLLFRNELETIIFSLPMEKEKGEVALSLLKAKSALKPSIDADGNWSIAFTAKLNGEIVMNTTNYSVTDTKFILQVKETWSSWLKEVIDTTLQTLQQELKTDALGFADQFYRHYPKEWNKVKDNWDEQFKQIKVTVHIETEINRVGKSSVPQGIPEDKVQK
ncbi:Ger(x)C family spore germination protein [Paenibacillus sp. y28]|uniref:Ger(x)C family spore germination protein n=1 Tax=Paenibacillus sp. y28 TaxID=3129110 RepID=UPI003015C102